LTIYELEDTDIINAMVAAKTANRNLDTRVIFNCASFKACNQPGEDGSRDPNGIAKKAFTNAGIEWKNADPSFTVTHQKTFTFDNTTSIIMTFNLNTSYFVSARDFAVITTAQDEVSEIVSVFQNDWASPVKPSSFNLLVWSPTNSRQKMENVIASAEKSIDVYMEEFNDSKMAEALVAAAKRLAPSGGVVRVITAVLTTSGDASKDGNLAMRQYLNKNGVLARYGVWQITPGGTGPSMYIHAKMILADHGTGNARAYVGSENFSATSLDKNRELGIVLEGESDTGLLDLLNKTFSGDWPKSTADTQQAGK